MILYISGGCHHKNVRVLSTRLLDFVINGLVVGGVISELEPYRVSRAIDLVMGVPFSSSFPSKRALGNVATTIALVFVSGEVKVPTVMLTMLVTFSHVCGFVRFPASILTKTILKIMSTIFIGFLFGETNGWWGTMRVRICRAYVICDFLLVANSLGRGIRGRDQCRSGRYSYRSVH